MLKVFIFKLHLNLRIGNKKKTIMPMLNIFFRLFLQKVMKKKMFVIITGKYQLNNLLKLNCVRKIPAWMMTTVMVRKVYFLLNIVYIIKLRGQIEYRSRS